MSEIQFPLLGDSTYGFRPGQLKDIEVPRVMLHSTELQIQHPDRDERLTFEAPLPRDFEDLIALLA